MSCPECAGECTCLGYKIPVPPRRDVKAWEALREELHRTENTRQAESCRAEVRRKHEIEREIVNLEARPDNPERARLIRRLRRELDGA